MLTILLVTLEAEYFFSARPRFKFWRVINEMTATRAQKIEKAVRDGLEPEFLELRDDSALHEGHSGSSPEGETHFHLIVVSQKFEGCSRVQRQRMVYKLLDEVFQAGLHALSLETMTPAENQ